MNTRTALLLGATGLVGGHCLDLLLADATYDAVVTLGRRPLGRSHPKLTHHVVDFDRLAEAASLIETRDVFCCLGTTMKKAGSKEAFRKVDSAKQECGAGMMHTLYCVRLLYNSQFVIRSTALSLI